MGISMEGGGKISGLLQLFRPKNAVMSVLGVLVGWLNVSQSFTSELLVACLVPPLILMAGNAINDYFDAPIDAINKPERPIPSGRVSEREALISYLVLSAIGVVISLHLGVEEFLIALAFSIAWYAYAKWLKAMGLVGNILVSLGVAFTLLFGALAAGRVNSRVVAFSSIAFTSNLAREVVKTIEDLEGDATYGLRTVAITLGVERAGIFAAILSLLSSLLALVPAISSMAGLLYLILTVIVSVPLLVYSAYLSTKIERKEEAGRVSSLLKISMLLGILGMLLDPLVR
ncbi:MAG TPA: hypothetical protein ENF57_01645 [Candidatus Korarchaeota archaeon]|nr:hypothetical protein [Candidatus Korarchaeota archaeon]